jgi:sporulation protein YlmC with PRC-barrel domain
MRPIAHSDLPPAHGRPRQWLLATAAVMAMAVAAGPSTLPALAQAVAVVDVVTLAQGYRASALTGTAVKNDTGEEIGNIDDFIIDQDKVLFVILQVGGFLGLGGHLVAVPYDSLEIADDGRTITLVVGGSKEELEDMDEFTYSEPE